MMDPHSYAGRQVTQARQMAKQMYALLDSEHTAKYIGLELRNLCGQAANGLQMLADCLESRINEAAVDTSKNSAG